MKGEWRARLWAVGAALVLLLLLYGGTSASILTTWARDPLGHGYLVVPAACYLAWTRREHVRRLHSRPAFWWLPLLGAVSFVWLMATLTSTTAVQQFCLAIMFVGFVWGTLGTAAARELAFPLGFLFFALPVGDYLVPVLQQVTARFAVGLLQLSGVPVMLGGAVISIPGSNWEVAAACSGINYLMSALVMVYLYAGLVYRSWPYRVAFFLAAAPVALLANGVRVYLTILVASLGAPEFADGMRHFLMGWLVFGIIVGAMFFISGHFQEQPQGGDERPDREATGSAVRIIPAWTAGLFVAVALAIVAVAPLSARRLLPSGSTAVQFVPPPVMVTSPWQPSSRQIDWVPRDVSPSATFARTYDAASKRVKLHVAYYNPNDRIVELGSGADALSGNGWVRTEQRTRPVSVAGGTVDVNETVLQSQAVSILVWSWYRVDRRQTSSDYLAKVLLATSRLTGSRNASAAVAVATEIRPEDDAAKVLQEFLTHVTLD